MRGIKVLAIMGLAVALGAVLVLAQATRYLLQITNPGPSPAQMLTITLRATDPKFQVITASVIAQPQTCPEPQVNIEGKAIVHIRWSRLCVGARAEGTVRVQVMTSFPATHDILAVWTGEKDSWRGEVTILEFSSVPTLTEWGLIVLGLLLAGSLAFMIRRRLAPRPAGA
ncbi:MAG: IPTL-CTERM sorting domain-containing protein [Candidatus Bipolaricaulota bacterium]|nr:IPTL-CTERM sorting domain-containing protein [Candidatus Bipolaricaulota bacterium]